MSDCPVSEAWVVLWHPMGSFRVQLLRDHVAICRAKCLEGGPMGSLVVGVAGSMDDAVLLERSLKEQVKAQRKAAQAAEAKKGAEGVG